MLVMNRVRGDTRVYFEELSEVGEGEGTKQYEWERSYVGARVNRGTGAASERIALKWDPKSRGGVANYVFVDDDRVYSLSRSVGVKWRSYGRREVASVETWSWRWRRVALRTVRCMMYSI